MEKPNLAELYEPPSDMIQRAVLDHLLDFHETYLKAATFFCLATASEGGLDASPRGGPAGFVHILDPRTVAFADWPGNNRIESMRNLEKDDRVGMLFIFPGLEQFMRINGRARVSMDEELRKRVGEDGKIPKVALVVSIDQVYFHCGKAINRARLWHDESRIARGVLPSPGQIMAKIAQLNEEQAEQLDEKYDHRVRNDLY